LTAIWFKSNKKCTSIKELYFFLGAKCFYFCIQNKKPSQNFCALEEIQLKILHLNQHRLKKCKRILFFSEIYFGTAFS
jgi:hypothetical protein